MYVFTVDVILKLAGEELSGKDDGLECWTGGWEEFRGGGKVSVRNRLQRAGPDPEPSSAREE